MKVKKTNQTATAECFTTNEKKLSKKPVLKKKKAKYKREWLVEIINTQNF